MIIGVGFKARSGKDTIGEYLVKKYSFVQESFAYPLKEYIGRQICGFTDKQLYGDLKEVVDPIWGLAPRKMLQTIGTDALREVVNDNFWIIPMRRKIAEHQRNNRAVVVTDVRFPNEADFLKSMGAHLIRLDRDNLDFMSNREHSSEISLEEYSGWDDVVTNNSSLEELYLQVDKLLNKYKNIKQIECNHILI